MGAIPDTYRAAGLWTIDQVNDYIKHSSWPTPTSSGDLSCYSTPAPRECSDCVFVNLDGIASSGTLVDPNGSVPSSGLSLPRKAWLVENDHWHWYNWWWYGNYYWNWYWRYPWYNAWYSYGWYWGWYCYRHWLWMHPVTLFDVTCQDISDKYPTCGSGTFQVSNFSWGSSFNGRNSLAFTPTSSGLLVNKNGTSDYWTGTNLGSNGEIQSTTTYARSIYSVNGVIPWNASYNYYSNSWNISKGIGLYDEYYTQTFDGIVNTGNTNNTNALNIVYSTGTSVTSNGYSSHYYGSLPDNDPLWSNLHWKAGYPAALTGNGSFWFAITYKTITVSSGYMNGWMYDSNGSGYPVPSNFGTTTTVNQSTNFYHYRGCGNVRNVTFEAISGSPLSIGLYNPNKKNVNPINYSYTHTVVNVCDSSYPVFVNGSIPFVFENCYWSDKHYGNYDALPEGGSQCPACDGGDEPAEYPDCLKLCGPCLSRDSVSAYGSSKTCADQLEELRNKVQLLNKFLLPPYLYTYHDPPNYLIHPDKNDDDIGDLPCSQLSNYDFSLYYGYNFGSYPFTGIGYYHVTGEGVNENFSYKVYSVAPLAHPKIAWSIGEYTVNQTECEKKTPINGEIWSSFQQNALEVVSAYYWDYPWFYYWGGWVGPYPGWFNCNSYNMCVNSDGKMFTYWSNRAYLQFDDDCVDTYDDEYPISHTYCGPCSTNRTVVDASTITSFTPSGLIRTGTSISKDRHCYLYDYYHNTNKTYKLYYEPVSGLIPIINGKAYDTDAYYASGNYTINLTGIYTSYYTNPIYNWINNNLTFGIRTSGTGSGSIFNYSCSSIQLYWPYCTGNIIPIKVVPSC